MVLNSLALYIFCGASTHPSASVVYTINLAVADLLVALSLPARIALYHSRGSCVACSYVHTFSYFVNMYCSILFLTRWRLTPASFNILHNYDMIRIYFSSFSPPLLSFSQYLYRSVHGCCPCVQYSPSMEDCRGSQMCQRHSVANCSCGHLLFPGKDKCTINTTHTNKSLNRGEKSN